MFPLVFLLSLWYTVADIIGTTITLVFNRVPILTACGYKVIPYFLIISFPFTSILIHTEYHFPITSSIIEEGLDVIA